MKRHGNLFEKIISLENLIIADKKASKGKSKQYGVISHRRNQEKNIVNLQQSLADKTFTTSKYRVFTISDGKERTIYQLPYYPDRIVHTAIINILEPIFVSTFIKNTYACIKGRGIHKGSFDLRIALKSGKKYCLKMDIVKFYPSIKNDILKQLLRKKFKDKELLWLLDDIIDSTEGVGIGSYTSQFFGNYYLSYFDHWVKENLKVEDYFRYSDDLIILSDSKGELWSYFYKMKNYLENKLGLQVKGNYQVFPIESRGIDWLGFKHYHTHTLIRKSIQKKYIKNKNKITHKGWLMHADTINLRRKYENN